MEGAEDLNVQALKNSPAYGARNVQIVAAGTGEALPGPATCGTCCWSARFDGRELETEQRSGQGHGDEGHQGKPCGHPRLRDLPPIHVTAPALDPT